MRRTDTPARSPLARSFKPHLRAEHRRTPTIATYLIGLGQAERFLRAAQPAGCADEPSGPLRATTVEAATRADLGWAWRPAGPPHASTAGTSSKDSRR
jgi:hypothetical protein